MTIGLTTSVIEAIGSTKLVQVADQYFMYAVGGSTGPAVKLNGAAVTLGQMGPWTAIGATQTASGYEVAWKLAGADTLHGLEHRQQRQLPLEHRRGVWQRALC